MIDSAPEGVRHCGGSAATATDAPTSPEVSPAADRVASTCPEDGQPASAAVATASGWRERGAEAGAVAGPRMKIRLNRDLFSFVVI